MMKIKKFGALSAMTAILSMTLGADEHLNHHWQLVNGKNWQITDKTAVVVEQFPVSPSCGEGMVEIKGQMKIGDEHHNVRFLQKQYCTKWIHKEFPDRCSSYDKEGWLKASANLMTMSMHFCIDRFEYPNHQGEYPIIAVTWYEAKATCESIGKRLATEDEWTFACEGEEAMPYPYGYVRDDTACVIDRPWKAYHAKNMVNSLRSSETMMRELDHLWQGEASGTRPRCVSPFGVYDLTGNTDEWVQRSGTWGKYQSVLKGGYWSTVRTRCRPTTRNHAESHYFYQQGFRCASDVK
jgi:sulfatase modifying factor 1